MADGEKKAAGLGRREALAVIGGGVAVAAGVIATSGREGVAMSTTEGGQRADEGAGAATRAAARMPVAFVPHGGGPWPFADLGVPAAERDELSGYLTRLAGLSATPPRALLVISAHWEEQVPTVMTHARPPMLFDYYGFPEHTYRLSWPAPGAPEVALRVRELLAAAGFASAEDATRGFDHGTFVPLMVTYPDATIPTLQLSLEAGLDPERHLAIGRALQPLRDEGVLILGSGMTYHNLRAFFRRTGGDDSERFDAWLRESTLMEASARDARLAQWSTAPAARASHPREEHLLPLMVIAGAAGDDRGELDYNGTYYGHRLSAYHFG